MRAEFAALADAATALARGSETLLVNFSGEQSDFVRFNRARVRQAFTTRQAFLTLRAITSRNDT